MLAKIISKRETKKKICLLGATGFIGSSIATVLNENDIDWIGLTRQTTAIDCLQQVSYEDPVLIREIIDEYPIVINALGSLKPKDFTDDLEKSLDSFWTMMAMLKTILVDANLNKFIHISSAGTVYGEAGDKPSEENDLLRPKSWYGRTKVIEEEQFSQLFINKKTPFLCARVSNPFGNNRTSTHGFIDVLLNNIDKNKPFIATLDKRSYRNFIYAPDMSKLLLALALSGLNGIYNVGSNHSTRLFDILSLVKSKISDAKIQYGVPMTDTDVLNSHICIKKIEQDLERQTITAINVLDYVNEAIEKILVRENTK